MRRFAAFGTVLLLGVVGEAGAQACVGSAAGAGQGTVGAGIGISGDVTSYGAGGGLNIAGPLTFGVGVTIHEQEELDDNLTSFGGSVGYELPSSTSLSLCPQVGVSRAMFSTTLPTGAEYEYGGTSFSGSFGAGSRHMLGDGLSVIPSAEVGIYRYNVTASQTGLGEFEESGNEFFGGAGLTLAWTRVWLSGGVSVSTEEESDASFDLNLGFRVP